MKLYLSSYRMGNHVDQLKKLTAGGLRVAVIDNAIDMMKTHIIQIRRWT